jgi:Ankyrin repeats (many copies)
LDNLIGARGYSVQTFATLSSAYYNKPTPLQIASYGTYTMDLVRSGNHQELETALISGISSNPCNEHGESLLHNVCRRADSRLFMVMLKAGCDVQVSDDCGRTPLHDACWAAQPSFEIVEKLLERDIGLLYMADGRGSLPLSYVRRANWSAWLQFFALKKDVYWPKATGAPLPPPHALRQPHTRPVPSPKQPLTLELAGMVANGRMTPAEARMLLDDQVVEDADSGPSYDDDSSSSIDDESSSCTDDKEDPDGSDDDDHAKGIWDEAEMSRILCNLSLRVRRPLDW